MRATELARAERLGEVVVAADLQTQYAVDLLVAGRQEQDRQLRALPDLSAQRQPVHLGHADVEHGEVEAPAAEQRQRFAAVARHRGHHVGAPEREADHVPDVGIVVGHEDGGSTHRPSALFAAAHGRHVHTVEIERESPVAPVAARLRPRKHCERRRRRKDFGPRPAGQRRSRSVGEIDHTDLDETSPNIEPPGQYVQGRRHGSKIERSPPMSQHLTPSIAALCPAQVDARRAPTIVRRISLGDILPASSFPGSHPTRVRPGRIELPLRRSRLCP